ncbi:hypothetical protein DFJ58DRAFT_741911 [Suillus subalutaceus]|uniref:uncharacterized protein n=1 Tax=Suillus subalutaceus TaxID=48586 RepID=UPI001B8864EA|nr:uncharacterized protein DFJ58DRAFT_741911 [Suillus subalutaceus]KAG1871721.1 hypothetical protein DFJ58DRAFT_741911 [Suillus subalutaceus]
MIDATSVSPWLSLILMVALWIYDFMNLHLDLRTLEQTYHENPFGGILESDWAVLFYPQFSSSFSASSLMTLLLLERQHPRGQISYSGIFNDLTNGFMIFIRPQIADGGVSSTTPSYELSPTKVGLEDVTLQRQL